MSPRELLLYLRLSPAISQLKLKQAALLLLKKDLQKWEWRDFLFQELKLSKVELKSLFSPQTQSNVQRNLACSLFVTILDDDYPPRLREIYDPPLVLFYQGNWQLVSQKYLLGVVGARKSTFYAKRAAEFLLLPLFKQQVITVSGLAAGVDSLAHRLSLRYGCPTIAVIGSGLAKYYPKQNQMLQQEIAKTNLVISEYSCDEAPLKYHFPARNRIIAGLVESLLVIEARHHSGSLITANLALQENRNVLAVPGPINSLLSAGTNELIAAGAKPALTAADIWEEFLKA